jgi:beta-glucosidase
MTETELEQLVDSLTLTEQASLLAGRDMWHTVAIERVGVPAMRVTDGPTGARGTEFGTGPASINVPCGTSLAATWDPDRVQQIGALLGRETRAKGARVLLAPTVNLHRTPIGGRNFECMSEDPYLTARTAVGYVRGVQSEGVASCIKHFVGNDTEFERMSIDSRIDERTLRETYLVPFEAAVTDAGVMSVMTGYNRINGPWAADSVELVDGVLRGEWGFDGLVMSDWFGMHTTVDALVAGLDLEMPGPTRFRGQQLVDAVESGDVDAALIRRSALNLLRVMSRVGAFDDGGPGDETTRLVGPDVDADTALVRRAGAAGMVLLRNQSAALPINPADLARVAVIGPNAAVGQIMGGGSAHVVPTQIAHPLASLRTRLTEFGVDVVYAEGCNINKRLRELDPNLCGPIKVEFYADPVELDDVQATPLLVSVTPSAQMMWIDDPTSRDSVDPCFGARLSATFTPDVSGVWELSIESVTPARLLIDGATLIDNESTSAGGSFFGMGKAESRVAIELAAGVPYNLVVELRRPQIGLAISGLTVRAQAPTIGDLLHDAVSAATAADVSIVVVGTNDDWECEGWDRTTLDLPGEQDELIRRVAAASRRTIVVVNAGSPVAMPWIDDVDAIVMAWFPGQQMGESLADILLGVIEPQGRLPVTFPARLEDTPAFEHYPGRNGVAEYREGRLVGYKWYDTIGRQPLFPFGFGLGYTNPVVVGATVGEDRSTVDVTVSNKSDRDGVQVVQVYVARTGPSERRGDEPVQRLIGFARLDVPAGQTVIAPITLDPRATMTWSVEDHAWVAADGPFELRIGTSSRDTPIRLNA